MKKEEKRFSLIIEDANNVGVTVDGVPFVAITGKHNAILLNEQDFTTHEVNYNFLEKMVLFNNGKILTKQLK